MTHQVAAFCLATTFFSNVEINVVKEAKAPLAADKQADRIAACSAKDMKEASVLRSTGNNVCVMNDGATGGR